LEKTYLLVLDADDTLWESAVFFRRAEEDFLALAEALGLPAELVRETVRRRDMERLPVTGYGAVPYTDTLEAVLREFVNDIPEWVRRSLADIRMCLLNHPILLLPGVNEFLKSVSGMPFFTVVYTMGEEIHQLDKFRRSGLKGLVDAFEIVSDKTSEKLRRLMNSLGYTMDRTIVVGNSPRSDVNPATGLGCRAFLLRRPYMWEAELEEFENPELITEIGDLAELLPLLTDLQNEHVSSNENLA